MVMAEFPAIPFWTDAYIGDTMHLTTLQHGAYLLLLVAAWRSPDCSLPDDDVMLARITRMDKRTWKANRDTILAFWSRGSDAKLFQKRLKDERKYVEDKRNKNASAGKASALKRLNRGSTPVQQTANINPTPTPTPTPIKEEGVPKGTPRASEVQAAFDAYNSIAKEIGLPVAQALTDRRRSQINARLKEVGGIEGWNAALGKLRASSFCQGGSNNGWKADLDFMLQQKSLTKLMEGSYDDRQSTAPRPATLQDGFAKVRAVIAEIAEREAGGVGEDREEDALRISRLRQGPA
jgi:uncharacterized protein YdaU (DUF1376 family)